MVIDFLCGVLYFLKNHSLSVRIVRMWLGCATGSWMPVVGLLDLRTSGCAACHLAPVGDRKWLTGLDALSALPQPLPWYLPHGSLQLFSQPLTVHFNPTSIAMLSSLDFRPWSFSQTSPLLLGVFHNFCSVESIPACLLDALKQYTTRVHTHTSACHLSLICL